MSFYWDFQVLFLPKIKFSNFWFISKLIGFVSGLFYFFFFFQKLPRGNEDETYRIKAVVSVMCSFTLKENSCSLLLPRWLPDVLIYFKGTLVERNDTICWMCWNHSQLIQFISQTKKKKKRSGNWSPYKDVLQNSSNVDCDLISHKKIEFKITWYIPLKCTIWSQCVKCPRLVKWV